MRLGLVAGSWRPDDTSGSRLPARCFFHLDDILELILGCPICVPLKKTPAQLTSPEPLFTSSRRRCRFCRLGEYGGLARKSKRTTTLEMSQNRRGLERNVDGLNRRIRNTHTLRSRCQKCADSSVQASVAMVSLLHW